MKKIILFGTLLFCIFTFLPMTGCSKSPDLTDYVSEYRSDLFSGTNGEYSVFATCSKREYPYAADGNVGDISDLFEVALTVPDNTKTYSIAFQMDGKTFSAEMAFDSVQLVHTWSQSIPATKQTTLEFEISCSEEENFQPILVTAESVKDETTLPLAELLKKISAAEADRLAALTSGSMFCGELYVRLLCEDGDSFYYVGLIDRSGSIYAMLVDAQNGDIIATKEQR